MSEADFQLSERYHIVRELGRGGMGTVYLAKDLRYQREVAIKVMHALLTGTTTGERFLREINVAARLTHPHIVPLLDSGTTDELLWFVMPVLEGQSLYDRIRAETQLPLADAVRIACEVAAALSYAHARGVVHRDIKPENVLLSGGSAALTDFGLATGLHASDATRLTEPGTAVGTAYYMSPEQATGKKDVDSRTDIYSLGCVLYEMLTGEPPYIGNTFQAIITKRFSDPIPSARRLRTTIPPAVDDVIRKALSLAPADRYQTADEFAADLVRAAGSDPNTSAYRVMIRTLGARKWAMLAAAGIISAAAIGGIVLRQSRAAAARHTPRSIAVLPFTNMSDDKSQEYFSAGMTDELLGALSSLPQLRVAARTSSYAMRDKAADPAAVGKKLNVEALLEGTVRKSGDQIQVTAELVSVADGFLIWSNHYNRKATDVFALQEELARAIVSAIQLELNGGQPIVRQSTANVGAYEMYLRGRHALDTRSAASIAEAAEDFRGAVDRDAQYARAWSGLADVYIFQGLNYYATPAETFPKAKAAAERALALDSTLAEAHTSLATVRFLYDRNFTGARQSYERAITLDPKYPQAHYFYSISLVGSDPARADREAAAAKALDPLSPPMAMAPGMIRVSSGRYADALPPLRAAIALEPNYYFPHGWLGLALAHAGGKDEAVAEARRAVQLNPNNALMLAFLGETYALTGDRTSALDVVSKIDSIGATRPVCGVYVARIFDRLGDDNRAMQWLDRAEQAHEGQLAQILWPDGFQHVRSDPRFQRLATRLGLSSAIIR